MYNRPVCTSGRARYDALGCRRYESANAPEGEAALRGVGGVNTNRRSKLVSGLWYPWGQYRLSPIEV
jgi:hypothetical protein